MRRWIAPLVAFAITSTAVGVRADAGSTALADLGADGGDFRVRVAAALALGKSKAPAARGALERSLGDPHVAVRAAVVAALRTLGDPASLPPLRAAQDRETEATVKTSLAAAVKRLEALRPRTKYLVAIGPVHDRTGAGAVVEAIVRQKLRDRLVDVPGVEVVEDGDEAATIEAAKGRKLPVLAVDGALARLSRVEGAKAGFTARVELSVRKLPDQVLKAFLGGGGEAIGGSTASEAVLAALRADAIGAAVESAVGGARQALDAAAKK